MSNIDLILEEKAANIGNFLVGRLLPFRQKRAVGPFVFIDHMGPVKLDASENLDVPPHPHIGLSTLTYLFEGTIVHKDSIGTEMEITPGAVNWMTAGKGVVHSERTPERLRSQEKALHGFQIWVALPKALEQSDPSFSHVAANEIPTWDEQGLKFKLIAGEALNRKSSVPVHSNLYFIEVKSGDSSETVTIGKELFGESALYVLDGEVTIDGDRFGTKQLLVAKETQLCSFELAPNTTVYVFGGEPFEEERYIDWNFVNSDKTVIEQAKTDWKNQTFPKVPGETDFVPLPERRFK